MSEMFVSKRRAHIHILINEAHDHIYIYIYIHIYIYITGVPAAGGAAAIPPGESAVGRGASSL